MPEGIQTYYGEAMSGLSLNQATKVTCRPFKEYYVEEDHEVIYAIRLLSNFTRIQAKSAYGDDLTINGSSYNPKERLYIGAQDDHIPGYTKINGPFKRVKIIDGLAEIYAIGNVKEHDNLSLDADMDIYARFEGYTHSDYMSDTSGTIGEISHGSKIQRWIDQSGNGNHLNQAAALKHPTAFNAPSFPQGLSFNPGNYQHFTGSPGSFNFGLQSNSGLRFQSWTIAAVIDTQGDYNGTICGKADINNTNDIQYWLLVDGQTFSSGSGGCTYATGNTAAVGDELITGGTVIVIASIGLFNEDAFIFHYRATDADGEISQVAGDLYTGNLTVGAVDDGAGLGYFFSGFMHELIFIHNRQNGNEDNIGWGPNQPTYEQLDAIGNYFANKWPVTWVPGVT